MADSRHRTLYQVVNYLKGLIDAQLANKLFWLKAEISNISSKSGHYYLDLVENRDGKIIAQCRASIWSYSVSDIKNKLGSDFDNILKKGAEVLVYAEVRFSEVYGLQLVISDVDKSFALGELEKRKRETFERLRAEGLLELNKLHQLPVVLQRLAIIGSPNTSGHTDLLKQLMGNDFGYHYDIETFPCSVQGEKAELEIIEQLNKVGKLTFDAVIMVRGGGSKLDLEVFNAYRIGKVIAHLGIPVLTGIGHETDISIADLAANQYFKTPSAVGAFIVAKSREFDIRVQTLYSNIRQTYEYKLQIQKHRIQQGLLSFKNASISYTQLRRGSLHTVANRLFTSVRATIAAEQRHQQLAVQTIEAATSAIFAASRGRLEEVVSICDVKSRQVIDAHQRRIAHQCELLSLHCTSLLKKHRDILAYSGEVIELFHPDRTLERGYAIVRVNGTVVTPDVTLNTGDGIEIELIDKRIRATVISESPKITKWKTLVTKALQRS